jgi:hypothetical protein
VPVKLGLGLAPCRAAGHCGSRGRHGVNVREAETVTRLTWREYLRSQQYRDACREVRERNNACSIAGICIESSFSKFGTCDKRDTMRFWRCSGSSTAV